MARNQTNNRKQQRKPVPPALIAYHVADRGENGFWTRIGAAWDHKDGEGYSIQLDLIPADGGRIVLRPLREENEEAEDATADDASGGNETDEDSADA